MGVLDKLKKTLKDKKKQNTSKKSLGTKQKGSSANKRDKRKTPNDEQSFRRQLLNEQKKKKQKTESVQKQFGEKSYSAKYGGNKPSYSTMKSAVDKKPSYSTMKSAVNKKKPSNTVGTVKKPTPAGTDPKEEKLKAAPSLAERAQNRKKLIDEYNQRTDNRYNVDVNGMKARQAIKSGEYQSDPEAAKFDVDNHKYALSLARGAASGASFGLSELLAAKAPMSEANREAEEYYQANKSKGAEFAGEVAGSLAGFVLTGEASAKAVGAAAKKVAPNLLERASSGITSKVMESRLLRRAAEKEAAMRFGVNGATEEIIQQIMERRAGQIATEIGKDMAINATTGAMADINNAIVDSENAGEFAGNMALNAGLNLGLGAATSVIPAFRAGRSVVDDAVRAGSNAVDNAGRNVAEDELARVTAETERLQDETAKLTEAPKVEKEPKQKAKATKQTKASEPKAGTKAEKPEPKKTNTKKVEAKAAERKTARETVNKREVKRLTAKEGVKKAKDSFMMTMVDSMHPFEKRARSYAKSNPEKMNTILGATNNYRSSNSIAGRSIFGDSQLDYTNNSIKDSKSLKDIFKDFKNPKNSKKANEELEKDFNYYLNLKHAPDRLREGKPIWEGEVYDNAKKNLLSDDDFVKGLNERKEKVEELKKDLKKAKTDKEKAAIQKEISTLETAMAKDTKKAVNRLKKIVDSEVSSLLEAHPEFEGMEKDVRKFLNNELQYRVDAGLNTREEAAELLRKYPNYVPTHREGFAGMESDIRGNTIGASRGKAAKGSKRDIRSIRDQIEEEVRQNRRDAALNDLLMYTFEDELSSEVADDAGEELEAIIANNYRLSKSKDGKRFFAEVTLEDGKRKHIEIGKEFVDALEDWHKDGRLGGRLEFIDKINDFISKPAEIWKRLITTDNPVFSTTNFKRDASEALINSKNVKESVECWPLAAKELLSNGPYAQALRNEGISQSMIINLDKAMEKAAKGGGGNPLAIIEGLNENVEMLPRLAEYMGTLKAEGIDVSNPEAILKATKEQRMRAAVNAADITVNFGRSGSIGKLLNRGYVPFFNASVQGADKFARNFSEQPSAKGMLKLIGRLTALGVAPTVGCNLIYGEHGFDNKNYQSLSARDKSTHWYVPIGDPSTTDYFVRISKSRIGAAVSAPFVNVGNESKADFADIVKIAKDSVGVVNPSDNRFGKAFWDALKSPEGETWYGQDIVPSALQNEVPSRQYDEDTSWFGKKVGQASEKVAKKVAKTLNIPEEDALEKTVSPKKVDYLIDQELGIIGDFALTTAPSKKGNGIGALQPLKEAWTLDATKRNDLSSRFYGKIDKATKYKNYTGKKKEKDELDRLNAYSDEVSNMNKTIKFLKGSNREGKQESIHELQRYKNSLMTNALDGKGAPSKLSTMNTVQKYVGTTYAIENFGSTPDKDAMKVYGDSKYGDISKKEMAKKIDADKDFYKGVKSIGKLEGKLKKSGIPGTTNTLTRAVALASIDADKKLFGAYGATKQGRVESANKMVRSKKYFKDGGSIDEYTKLEKARKTLGKLPDDVADEEAKKVEDQLRRGAISESKYYEKLDEIDHNANISYLGLATSLAQANSPKRGYELYDIKPNNIQKGINLAAMGFSARDYRKMAKAVDTDGNGYPSKAEITAYVSKSGVKDKATLFDALYYYKGSRNPFGTPTNYTRAQAAKAGKKAGIEAIEGDTSSFEVKEDSSSSGSGYGYRRYGRWRSWGSGGRSRRMTGLTTKSKTIKKDIPHSKTYQHSTRSTKAKLPTVKFKEENSTGKSIRTALEDIQRTEKKVAPPKARR